MAKIKINSRCRYRDFITSLSTIILVSLHAEPSSVTVTSYCESSGEKPGCASVVSPFRDRKSSSKQETLSFSVLPSFLYSRSSVPLFLRLRLGSKASKWLAVTSYEAQGEKQRSRVSHSRVPLIGFD